jgi:hypothetical protein
VRYYSILPPTILAKLLVGSWIVPVLYYTKFLCDPNHMPLLQFQETDFGGH